MIDGLLESVQGLLAVLNEHRQILVVNQSLMTMLGVKNGDRLLGLRQEKRSSAYTPMKSLVDARRASSVPRAVQRLRQLSHWVPSAPQSANARSLPRRRVGKSTFTSMCDVCPYLSRGNDSYCSSFGTSAFNSSVPPWKGPSITTSVTWSTHFSPTALLLWAKGPRLGKPRAESGAGFATGQGS